MPPSSSRADESARINALRCSLPFATQSAIAAFLEAARNADLPVAGRKRIRDARDEACLESDGPYGPLHNSVEVGGVVFEVQNPFAMLHRCSQTHGLKPLVQSVLEGLRAVPDRPLNIVLYGDEITPGNALAHTHKRKSWGIYWTLLEFGPAALSCEDRVW